ncbi:MAG: hypothetical protein AB7Q17_13770 [Phycisphaerae bacterium]
MRRMFVLVTLVATSAAAFGDLQGRRMVGKLYAREYAVLGPNGEIAQDWTPITPPAIAGVTCSGGLGFDAAELTVGTADPVGGECTPAGIGGTPDTRLWFGPTYNAFRTVEDIRVGPAAAGQRVGWIAALMNWLPGAGQTQNLMVVVRAFDACDFTCAGPPAVPATGGLWAVIFNFGPVVDGSGGYYILNMDLCTAPDFIRFPADGEGAYEFIYAQAASLGPPLTFTNPTRANTMFWGFRDDDTVPNDMDPLIRPGHPADPVNPPSNLVWNDDTPADGQFNDPANECFLLPSLNGVAPACLHINTETAWSWWLAGVPDPCNAFIRGDSNCDGAVNAFDIDPFVLAIVNPDGPGGYTETFPNCDLICANDIDQDGNVNAFDIDGFVQCVVDGACP